MKYITKEVRIGIAGIAALCILVYGINYLKGINMFKPSSYFYVKFQNVNGLTKSSPVFADGFRMGIVRDLYYDYTQPGKVVAEIDVDPELRIPKGSTAELAAEMLGGVKMNLLLAKDFSECVVYISNDSITVAVPAPAEGLSEEAVARITDVICTETEYDASQLNIIEVKA